MIRGGKAALYKTLLKPVDAAALGVFRILWGMLMCLETNWLHNQLHGIHHPDALHFYYQGFSWIRHFPSPWMMELELVVMLLAALLIMIGWCFRPAAIVFTLTYGHFFFAEAIAYNNHLYLIVLVSFLISLTRADERFSVRRFLKTRSGIATNPIPQWNYLILKLQVIIVYFYGGIAKFSRDWLIEMEPVRFWLQNSPRPSEWFSKVIRQEWFTPFTAWGGLLIDLICPFMLLFSRTRWFAICILILFHLINSQIFNIGYFPLMGILLILPFLPPDLRRSKSPATATDGGGLPVSAKQRVVFPVLAVYFAFQLLFPLRWHLWSPHDPLWTEKGQRFAWRMMLREKISVFQVRFADPEVKSWFEERPGFAPLVSPSVQSRIGQNPYFIWQYVRALKETLAQYGKGDTPIHVFATCSLNGRPFYPLVDPNVDLSKVDCPFGTIPDWILPLPDLKVDFDQIQPLEEKARFSEEALRRWISENPGPAAGIQKLYKKGPVL